MGEDENNDYLQAGPADSGTHGEAAAKAPEEMPPVVPVSANPDASGADGSAFAVPEVTQDPEATQAYNPFEFIDEPAPPVPPAQPAAPLSVSPLTSSEQASRPVPAVSSTQPVPPTQPETQPLFPVQPVAQPVQPASPVQPAQPVLPVQPVPPAQPAQPTQPAALEETQAFVPLFAQTESFTPTADEQPQSFAPTVPPVPRAPIQASVPPVPQVPVPQAPVTQQVPETTPAEQTQAYDPFSDESLAGSSFAGSAVTDSQDANAHLADFQPETLNSANAPEDQMATGVQSMSDLRDASDIPDASDEWNSIMNEPEEATSLELPGKQTTQRKRMTTWAIIFAAIVLVLLGGILFLHFHYANRVAPGVSLGGTDLGGMTESQARSEVQTIAGQTTVSVTGGDTTVVSTLNDLGVTVDVDKTVSDILATKPANSFGGFFERINPFARRSAVLDASTDESTMLTYLTDAMIDEDQRLENATVAYNKDLSRYTYTDSKDGKTVDLTPVKDAVSQALADPGTAHSATTTVQDGTATVTTQTASSICDQANQRLNNPVVLRTDGGTSMTIPVSTVASWITLTTDLNQGSISLDYDSSAIDQYVADSVSGQLNRDATDEIIVKDSTGKQLGTLQSGKKGVQVNDTSTVGSQILTILQDGNGGKITVGAKVTDYKTQTQTRNLTGDNGDMWVQVDLTQQTLTVSNGSTEVKKIDISTGTAGSATVTGTYFVWDRAESGAVVGEDTGSNNPQWITYYNGDVAILGADWDQESITKGMPSTHGCIYMSSADAKWVYDNVKNDVVVVVSGGTPTQPARNDGSDKDNDSDKDNKDSDNKDSDNKDSDSSKDKDKAKDNNNNNTPSASASSSSAAPSSSATPTASSH